MVDTRFTISPEWLDADGPPAAARSEAENRARRSWCWVDGVYCDREAPLFQLRDYLAACQVSACIDVRAYGTEPRHFSCYHDAFMEHVEDMGLLYPPYATRGAMAEAIRGLLNKNRYFGSVLVRMVAYAQRREDEFGVPRATTSLLMYADPSPTPFYAELKRKLFVGFYRGIAQAAGPRSHVRQLADPVAWDAQPYMDRMGYSNCLLLNAKGRVASPLLGTLYMLRDRTVYTPPLSEGARYDPIRLLAPQLIGQTGRLRVEEKSLTVEEVRYADELFILSTAKGVEGILGVETRRYFRNYSARLIEPLNRLFFPDQF